MGHPSGTTVTHISWRRLKTNTYVRMKIMFRHGSFINYEQFFHSHLVSKECQKLRSSAKVCNQGLNKAQLLGFRRGSFGRAKQGQEAPDG